MMCPKCGAYISDDATFCPVCGTAVNTGSQGNPSMMNTGGMPPMPPNNNGSKGLVILLCGIAAAVIFVVTAIVAFLAMSGSPPFGPKETPTPAPTASPAPTPTAVPATTPPQPTPQIVYVPQTVPDTGTSSSSGSSYHGGGYKTYYSDTYDFSCDYPAGFSVYNDGGTLTLYTVVSPDGEGTEKIVAKPNEGETVSSSGSEFLSTHRGTIIYQSVGSDYYAYNVRNGNTEYYRYCKFANGNLYWFEFTYPTAQHEIYDAHINNVYNSFTY